jgi:hypothetical protein
MEIAVQCAQLAVALFGTLLLALECWYERRGRNGTARVLRDRTFAALTVLGVAAYVNFGTLHEGRFIHIWDTYHYYVGAKYSPELGYDLLYRCTAVADAESGLRREVETRTMTDLRTNQQVTTLDILLHPETCVRRFSPARWDSFKYDVAWFRERVDWRTWHQMQRDHGYNATPVWNALGHLLADLSPASDLQITCLALLDPVLLVAALALLRRSFGWRACAIAALTLGTFYPSRFYWTGGAFLRFDWLFCIVAGLCALKKERPLLAGAALAYAAVLRLFPAVLLVGPVLAALDHVRRTRTWNPAHLRLFAGAAIAVAIAVPSALAISGDCGESFVENTIKHAETPLTNHMGLPTLLSYRPDTTVRQLRERTTADLWPRFKQARLEALSDARPVIIAAGLVVLVLLVRAARHELWRITALSLVLIAVFLQLTCYYYVFVIALAVLAERRPRIGVVLLGMCAASMLVATVLAPRVGMDETYLACSLVTMLGLFAAWALGLVDTGRVARRPALR